MINFGTAKNAQRHFIVGGDDEALGIERGIFENSVRLLSIVNWGSAYQGAHALQDICCWLGVAGAGKLDGCRLRAVA